VTPAAIKGILVDRATRRLTEYAKELALVIGVEHYSQYMGGEGFARAYKKVLLVSEFALVRVNDDWLGFRDVFEVDGKRVPDREDRLRKLFLDKPDSAVDQARQITDESARHNLGAIQRNFNVPTMALFFLSPANAARFSFRKDGEDTIEGHPVWKVRYEERRRPTIIRTASGKDMPVKGTFWIDAAAGTVWKTHMEISVETKMGGAPTQRSFDGGTVVRRVQSSASVTVTFREDAGLGLVLPGQMLETYEGPTVNKFTGDEEISRVNCVATYSDFRRFQTTGRVVPK
jgi:hypothetical protein